MRSGVCLVIKDKVVHQRLVKDATNADDGWNEAAASLKGKKKKHTQVMSRCLVSLTDTETRSDFLRHGGKHSVYLCRSRLLLLWPHRLRRQHSSGVHFLDIYRKAPTRSSSLASLLIYAAGKPDWLQLDWQTNQRRAQSLRINKCNCPPITFVLSWQEKKKDWFECHVFLRHY